MDGLPEAIEAAHKLGMRIIPGVEISTKFILSGSTQEVSVHVLAYFSSLGPSRVDDIEKCLASIRDGRYIRARNMVMKLKRLNKPIEWERVIAIAGHGVAPGRVHVARAMVEAGHVANIEQAFSKYLCDEGPAYATGNEPFSTEVVELICRAGGVAALAHPWALKNPLEVIRGLKDAGLHAMEVYRGDKKLSEFSDLAAMYGLIRLGGSDYHGKGSTEWDLGSVVLSTSIIRNFLQFARPVWCTAMKEILLCSANQSCLNVERMISFRVLKHDEDQILKSIREVLDLLSSSRPGDVEKQDFKFESLIRKVSEINIDNDASA